MYGFFGETLKIPESEKRAIVALLSAVLGDAIKAGPPLPRTVYQYTSAPGLKGIVESGTVHATHIAYMNDSSEYLIGIRIFEELLKAYRPLSAEVEALFTDMRPRLAGTSPFNFAPVFVSCFSAARNDLNQWRAYSGSMGGYCLGFDAQKLWTKAYKLGAYMAPVIYDRELAKRQISNFLHLCVVEFARVDANYAASKKSAHLQEWVTTLFSLTSRLLPILKDPSFSAEQEWRIIYSLNYLTEVRTKVRARTNILCPYVELRLGEKNSYPEGWAPENPGRLRELPDRLPISEIIAGPSEQEELAFVTARALLESCAYDAVTVSRSQLPYRSVI